MSYFADQNMGRNALRRVEVLEVDDSGTQQLVTVKGLAGEEFKMPYRGQYFGATGVPPVGSDGFALLVAGRPDQAILMGIEHQEHRVRDLNPGEKAIYDAHGNVIKLLQTAEISIVTGTLKIDADMEINGDITLTGDIDQTGGITSSDAHVGPGHV